jgi:hypothetical protein
MTRPRKRVHLAAHFPGVNNTTVWADPRSGSQIDFTGENFRRGDGRRAPAAGTRDVNVT